MAFLGRGGGVHTPVEIDRIVKRGLPKVAKQLAMGADPIPGDVTAQVNHILRRTHRKNVVGCVVIVEGAADLFEIVGALNAAGGFAGRLHGGKQQCDQDGNNRDDDQ